MKEIMEKLKENGFESFIVGGYVRDYILGLTNFDIDICTSAKIEDIERIFNGRGVSNREYYSYHIEDDPYNYDITSYREELEYKKNKPVRIKPAKTFRQDLLRRDFTINTLAIDINGKLVDRLYSKKDLDNKLIKVVGKTNKKFEEDKTRIMRAIRFYSTLEFDLDIEIKSFLKEKAHLLNDIPKEYKRKEIDKIFDSKAHNRFFALVKAYNLEKYLNIKVNYNVKDSYDKYGIYSQIETDLPFSKKERKIINEIKDIIDKQVFKISDIYKYDDIVVNNISWILNLDKEINAVKELNELNSIIEIDISIEDLLKYINVKDIKKVYKDIERKIMIGELINEKSYIIDYLEGEK